MSFMLRSVNWFALTGLMIGISWTGMAQVAYFPQGSEYPVAGRLVGDQVQAQAALHASGGFLVWQDNATDGIGSGISALRLDSHFSGSMNAFRVNEAGAGEQDNPQVALLKNGGAIFVWQGEAGKPGFPRIFARFLTSENTFATGDIQVNTYSHDQSQQVNPAVAVLTDGNVVVVWSSYEQDGDLQGIFGQRLSPTGDKIGPEFQVNQTSPLNQRTPSLTALANGGFAIAWISEKQMNVEANGGPQFLIDVYARLYQANGEPAGTEFLVNQVRGLCANPVIRGDAEGGFLVAWGKKDLQIPDHSWDIFTRSFAASGSPLSDEARLNTRVFGDQYGPKVASLNADYLVIWSSMGQDDDKEGVYGQAILANNQKIGEEFRVNTTTVSRQIHPTVASDGANRYFAVWSGFVGGATSFELLAQRYASAQAIVKPDAPFATALSSSRISVTWPSLAGLDIAFYELTVDDQAAPVIVTGANRWLMTSLAPNSSHTFSILYQLTDGRRSPRSEVTTAKTWDEDLNGDGLPDDWQAMHWGANSSAWPASATDSDQDGASNYAEFLAGTNPLSATNVLRTFLTSSEQGWRLNWNTQPGFVYQVQVTTDVNVWKEYGTPRFAVGASDSLPVDGAHSVSYYRVIRLR